MERNWYKIAFYAAVLLNLILLAEVFYLKFAPVSPESRLIETVSAKIEDLSDYLSVRTLPDVMVIDSTGKSVSIRALVAQAAPLLVVFFTPGDCHTCLEERVLWGEIARRTGVQVVGVASNPDISEFRTWAAQIGFPVPVFIDTSYAILDSMQVRVRPLKVLFDRRGDAVWADGTRLRPEEQEQFWPLFKQALGRMKL